ncbi:MAG: hypothetical protein H7331_01800 [Bacteroidia bacterium]|nr:hypothetical protein [Bacteroidia bacterium]
MNPIKNLLLFCSGLFLFITLNSCKKEQKKQGVLELQIIEIPTAGKPYVMYVAIATTDTIGYGAEKEFELENSSTHLIKGYYWPTKTLKHLGYTQKMGSLGSIRLLKKTQSSTALNPFGEKFNATSELSYYKTKEGEKIPAKNGHWPVSELHDTETCPKGTWYKPSCAGNEYGDFITLRPNETGTLSTENCGNGCNSSVIVFTYQLRPTYIRVSYSTSTQPIVYCLGSSFYPTPPTDNFWDYTCNGTTLTVTYNGKTMVYNKLKL